jgi:hypothetical protein
MTEPGSLDPPAEDAAGLDGDEPIELDDVLDAEDPEPAYLTIEGWVAGYFVPMFRRTLGGEFRWCHHWWQHGEAISRLTALWHSWEVLRLQPGTGIATWYRDYLDQQLPILLGARGPFYQCSETSHREPRQANAAPVPDDWWDLDPDDPDSAPLPGPPALQPATGGTDART